MSIAFCSGIFCLYKLLQHWRVLNISKRELIAGSTIRASGSLGMERSKIDVFSYSCYSLLFICDVYAIEPELTVILFPEDEKVYRSI